MKGKKGRISRPKIRDKPTESIFTYPPTFDYETRQRITWRGDDIHAKGWQKEHQVVCQVGINHHDIIAHREFILATKYGECQTPISIMNQSRW
jgi:hypothetical protein